MESIKGREVFILTTDWIDERSTIRQSVDSFENEEDAKAELKAFDEEVGDWVKNNRPIYWKRDGDGLTFIEYGKEGNYYDSHAVAKITKCVVK